MQPPGLTPGIQSGFLSWVHWVSGPRSLLPLPPGAAGLGARPRCAGSHSPAHLSEKESLHSVLTKILRHTNLLWVQGQSASLVRIYLLRPRPLPASCTQSRPSGSPQPRACSDFIAIHSPIKINGTKTQRIFITPEKFPITALKLSWMACGKTSGKCGGGGGVARGGGLTSTCTLVVIPLFFPDRMKNEVPTRSSASLKTEIKSSALPILRAALFAQTFSKP